LGASRAVGDDVEAEFALGVLGAEVALAGADLGALGHHHELVDELLHVRQHVALVRQRDLLVVHADRPVGDLVERLLEDAARLLHLLDAAEIAVVRVAGLADGNVEVVVLVAEVRALLAQIPLDARRAQTRAREAVADRDVARHHADALQAIDPDAVRREQALDVALDALRQVLDEALDAVDPAGRQVARVAADAAPAHGEARARQRLHEVVDVLALLEAVEEDAQRADVHRERADAEEMRRDASQLRADDADGAPARRQLDPDDRLDG